MKPAQRAAINGDKPKHDAEQTQQVAGMDALV
jgi:hypothetical protein